MTKRRFAAITEDDLEANRHQKMAKSTMYGTSSVENTLKQYYSSEAGASSATIYEELTKECLNKVLEKFFLACRMENGDEYKASTLTTMRQCLIRSIKTSHGYDIAKDGAFQTSTSVFLNRQKYLKSIGKGDVQGFNCVLIYIMT